MKRRLHDLTLLLAGALAAVVLLRGPFGLAPAARGPSGVASPAVATDGGADLDRFVRLASADIDPGLGGTLVRGQGSTGTPVPWSERVDRPEPATAGPLSPEMIESCLAVARDIDARLAEQLETLRARDQTQFESKLRQSRRLVALAELRRRDPNVYDLKRIELETDARVSRLATEVRRARREGRASDARALEEELRPQVIVQLAFRYRSREDYLCRIQELVDRLDKELAHDLRHFDEVLERRMTELLAGPARTGDGRDRAEDAGLALGPGPVIPLADH